MGGLFAFTRREGMTRYSSGDGTHRVAYVPTIANIAAPTTTELNAGTLLHLFIPKDGLKVPTGQNMVDSFTLGEKFDSQVVGSYGGPLTLTMFRDQPTDAAWNLITYGLAGYIVVRRGTASATAWTVADKVEVYPVQFHKPVMMDTAANDQAKFTATAAVTSEPNEKATVA